MRSDFHRAGGEFVVYGLGSVLTQAFSIILIPVYTRCLGVADYGILSLLTGLQLMLVPMAQAGLGSALFRSYFDVTGDAHRNRIIATTFYLLLPMALCVGGVTHVFASAVAGALGSPAVGPEHVRWVAWIVVLEALLILPFSVFRARRQSARYVATSLFSLAARLTCVIYLVVFRQGGVNGVLQGILAGAILGCGCGYLQMASALTAGFDRHEGVRLLRFGLPLIPLSAAGWVLAVSGRYILSRDATMDDVGLYALAERLSSVVAVLLVQPLGLLWLPSLLSAWSQGHGPSFCRRMLVYYTMAGVFGSVCLSLWVPEVMPWLAPPTFHAATRYVFPLCLGGVAFGASRILNVGSDLARTPERYTLALLIACALFLAGCSVLVPAWGIGGLVTVSVCASSLVSGLVFLFGIRQHPVRFDWGRMASTLALGVLVYAAAHFLGVGHLGATWRWGAKGALTLGFIALLLVTRTIRPEEREACVALLARAWARLGIGPTSHGVS